MASPISVSDCILIINSIIQVACDVHNASEDHEDILDDLREITLQVQPFENLTADYYLSPEHLNGWNSILQRFNDRARGLLHKLELRGTEISKTERVMFALFWKKGASTQVKKLKEKAFGIVRLHKT